MKELLLSLSTKIDLHIFMIILLIFISIHMKQSKGHIKNVSYVLFQLVIFSMLLNTILDLVGWVTIFSGESGVVSKSFNFNLNSIIYATLSLPLSFWLIYIDYKIYGNKDDLKRRGVLYFLPTVLQMVLALHNVRSGFIFTISETGQYIRGDGFYIVVLTMYLLPIVAICMMYKNRKTMSFKLIEVIMLFWILPIISAALQLMYYGLMITWPVFDLVTIFAYILVEKESMLKDPLTQLNTRRVFEERANELIKRKVPFSILMIDLDEFKSINDNFGHHLGDEALINIASILEKSIHGGDVLCRFGGDEFLILVVSSKANGGRIVLERIENHIKKLNDKALLPFEIKMSIGHKFFDNKDRLALRDKLKEVDQLMYAQKIKSEV